METAAVSLFVIYDCDVSTKTPIQADKKYFLHCTFVGPLTYTTRGRAYVTGVVSWGAGCESGKSQVYARVTAAMPFINEELSKTC